MRLVLRQAPEHFGGHLGCALDTGGNTLHAAGNALEPAHDGVEFETQDHEAYEQHTGKGQEQGTLATHEAADFKEHLLVHG
jgi:hypothetical protein